MPSVGLAYARPLTPGWTLVARISCEVLPDALADSPLLEDGADHAASVMIGIGRSF